MAEPVESHTFHDGNAKVTVAVDRGLEKTVSLFGNLDATEVNDDPFFIEPNTYKAICHDAVVKEANSGDMALIITWQIDEPANDYHEKKLTDYFTLVPQDVAWEDLDSKQKDKVKFLKRRLRRAFGVPESEINSVKPSDLIGAYAYIQIVEGEGKKGTANEGKKFTNIRDAMNPQLFEEEGGKKSEKVNSSLGL